MSAPLRVSGPRSTLRPYSSAAFEQLVEGHDDLALTGCYPELDSDDDVSMFSDALDHELPDAGRAVVVLTRLAAM